MNAPDVSSCPLCAAEGGRRVWRGPAFRVVGVDGEEGQRFPGFYRLIWQAHVAELSALSRAERDTCMEAVTQIEHLLRERLQPDKINLASLGNVVPHLHWHVVPRWRDDSHFPNPIWGQALREAPTRALDLAALDAALAQRLTSAMR